jgi:hypothetical protein
MIGIWIFDIGIEQRENAGGSLRLTARQAQGSASSARLAGCWGDNRIEKKDGFLLYQNPDGIDAYASADWKVDELHHGKHEHKNPRPFFSFEQPDSSDDTRDREYEEEECQKRTDGYEHDRRLFIVGKETDSSE